MARITIEDCMEHVPNRFHLVRMASIRAKQLKRGARPLLVSEENKHVVMSLREIAAGLVKPGDAQPPAGHYPPQEVAPPEAALQDAPGSESTDAATEDVEPPVDSNDSSAG